MKLKKGILSVEDVLRKLNIKTLKALKDNAPSSNIRIPYFRGDSSEISCSTQDFLELIFLHKRRVFAEERSFARGLLDKEFLEELLDISKAYIKIKRFDQIYDIIKKTPLEFQKSEGFGEIAKSIIDETRQELIDIQDVLRIRDPEKAAEIDDLLNLKEGLSIEKAQEKTLVTVFDALDKVKELENLVFRFLEKFPFKQKSLKFLELAIFNYIESGKLDLASKFTQMIPDVLYRSQMLQKISYEYLLKFGNLDQALKVAKEIPDEEVRSGTLRIIQSF